MNAIERAVLLRRQILNHVLTEESWQQTNYLYGKPLKLSKVLDTLVVKDGDTDSMNDASFSDRGSPACRDSLQDLSGIKTKTLKLSKILDTVLTKDSDTESPKSCFKDRDSPAHRDSPENLLVIKNFGVYHPEAELLINQRYSAISLCKYCY